MIGMPLIKKGVENLKKIGREKRKADKYRYTAQKISVIKYN